MPHPPEIRPLPAPIHTRYWCKNHSGPQFLFHTCPLRQYNQVTEKLGKLLKAKLDDEYSGSMQWLGLAEKFFENCFQGREIMESDNIEAKRELIRSVGSNLILKDGKLNFTLKKPYDVLLKPEIRSDWQG